MLFGLTGVAVMIGLDLLGGLGLHVIAEFAVVAAALSYAFAGIFGRRFKGFSPLVTATGQITATTIMMLPISEGAGLTKVLDKKNLTKVARA